MASLIEGSFAFNLTAAALEYMIGDGKLEIGEARKLIDLAERATMAELPQTPEKATELADRLREVIQQKYQKMLDRS